MKITVEKEAILAGLQKVQMSISNRTPIPAIQNILFRAETDHVELAATDLELTVRAVVPATVAKAGCTTLPSRRILNIFRDWPEAEAEIVVEDDLAEIKSGKKLKYKIVGMPEEDFPKLPEIISQYAYTVPAKIFRDMLRQTGYAVSRDTTRTVLTGLLLSFKGDKLILASTDGRRMAMAEHEMEFPADAQVDLVLPGKTVAELLKTLGDTGDVKIQAVKNQISFAFDNLTIYSNLIEGQYPNYQQVIPAQCDERIGLPREDFMGAVSRVALVASEQSASIKLTFADNRVELLAQSAEVGEARESVAIKYGSKEISMMFNPDFLLEPLRTLEQDEVFLELSDERSPGVLKTDAGFLYVIMPVRLN